MKREIIDNTQVIIADEGMKLTNWDKQDIMHYSSCSMLFAGMDNDLSSYYEITIEEDEQHNREFEQKLKDL